MEDTLKDYTIDFVEIYTPMAKLLSHWHQQVLGFHLEGAYIPKGPSDNKSSYVLTSGKVRLVLTSTFPSNIQSDEDADINAFVQKNQCGVKRVALVATDVQKSYDKALNNGGVSVQNVSVQEDENGSVCEAGIRLYEDNEIIFIDRSNYKGYFKPGYKKITDENPIENGLFESIDHIAAEVSQGKTAVWTDYLTKTIGTELIQSIEKNEENKTGMELKINQSKNKAMTFVMAEPDGSGANPKIEQNINKFVQGIHHLAFSTKDIISTIEKIRENNVDFVNFPPSYYTLLRENPDFADFDIDQLEKEGILIDKEEDTYLYQKFIKPYGDRPFFFYEIVQRVNGYNGFALKNINVLKKAEEMEIMAQKK